MEVMNHQPVWYRSYYLSRGVAPKTKPEDLFSSMDCSQSALFDEWRHLRQRLKRKRDDDFEAFSCVDGTSRYP